MLALLFLGRAKPKPVAAAADEYIRRLSRLTRLNVRELRDERLSGNPELARKREGERILKAVHDTDWLVVCDERGQEATTPRLTRMLEQARSAMPPYSGRKRLVFVIGGATGISPDVHQRADDLLRLSGMVLAGGVARVVLTEGLYRAAANLQGHPYHNE